MDIRPSRSQTKTQIIFSGGANNVMSPASCRNLQHALALDATLCNFSWNLQLATRFATSLGNCNTLVTLCFATSLGNYKHKTKVLRFEQNDIQSWNCPCQHNESIVLHTGTCKYPKTFMMDSTKMTQKGQIWRRTRSTIPCKDCFQHHFFNKWIWVNDKNAYEQT